MKFKIGDRVLVTPKIGHEFQGLIVDVDEMSKGGGWIIEDQDSDFFCCAEDELELIEED